MPYEPPPHASARPANMIPPPPPPPPPPPLHVMPLEYASPRPPQAGINSRFHQAARASWRAPVVALILGTVTGQIRSGERAVAMFIGGVNALLIVAGLVCAVVALFGVK